MLQLWLNKTASQEDHLWKNILMHVLNVPQQTFTLVRGMFSPSGDYVCPQFVDSLR